MPPMLEFENDTDMVTVTGIWIFYVLGQVEFSDTQTPP